VDIALAVAVQAAFLVIFAKIFRGYIGARFLLAIAVLDGVGWVIRWALDQITDQMPIDLTFGSFIDLIQTVLVFGGLGVGVAIYLLFNSESSRKS
jgi:hypothetical protein